MAILPTLLLEHPIRQIRLIYPNLHIAQAPILLLQELDQVTLPTLLDQQDALQTLQDQQDTLRALQVKLSTHLQGIHHMQLDILRNPTQTQAILQMTPGAPVIRPNQLRATLTHKRVGWYMRAALYRSGYHIYLRSLAVCIKFTKIGLQAILMCAGYPGSGYPGPEPGTPGYQKPSGATATPGPVPNQGKLASPNTAYSCDCFRIT